LYIGVDGTQAMHDTKALDSEDCQQPFVANQHFGNVQPLPSPLECTLFMAYTCEIVDIDNLE
jgi:hypothetical protein